MLARSTRRRGSALLVAAIALVAAAPAHAGFTFVSSFGGQPDLSASGAAGRLDNPFQADAAADGTLYVVDRGNERIAKFSAEGVFERAWGKNVDPSGGTGAEVCTTTCQQGAQGSLKGEIRFAWGIAVSPDGTQVYLADYFNNRVQQFTSAGAFVRVWGQDVNASQAGTDFGSARARTPARRASPAPGPGTSTGRRASPSLRRARSTSPTATTTASHSSRRRGSSCALGDGTSTRPVAPGSRSAPRAARWASRAAATARSTGPPTWPSTAPASSR